MARRKGEMSSKDNQRKRKIAWEMQGGECWLCHKPLPLEETTLDHVFPFSIGGSNRQDNLRVAHGICNSERQNFHLSKEELWYWSWVAWERGWRRTKPKCPRPTLLKFENGKPTLKELNDKDGTLEPPSS